MHCRRLFTDPEHRPKTSEGGIRSGIEGRLRGPYFPLGRVIPLDWKKDLKNRSKDYSVNGKSAAHPFETDITQVV